MRDVHLFLTLARGHASDFWEEVTDAKDLASVDDGAARLTSIVLLAWSSLLFYCTLQLHLHRLPSLIELDVGDIVPVDPQVFLLAHLLVVHGCLHPPTLDRQAATLSPRLHRIDYLGHVEALISSLLHPVYRLIGPPW